MKRQVVDAIDILKKEGTIMLPMNNEQYEQVKDHKFMILEDVHRISKGNINFGAQMALFTAIDDYLKQKHKSIKYEEDISKGLFRLK